MNGNNANVELLNSLVKELNKDAGDMTKEEFLKKGLQGATFSDYNDKPDDITRDDFIISAINDDVPVRNKDFLDGDKPQAIFGGKSRNQVCKEMEEHNLILKKAEEIIFSCRCDRFDVMWDDWGMWTVFATCRDEFQAKMIQDALKKQGKTTRITAYKELSKMFDVVYGDKVDKK